jgi:hypothetical protein
LIIDMYIVQYAFKEEGIRDGDEVHHMFFNVVFDSLVKYICA